MLQIAFLVAGLLSVSLAGDTKSEKRSVPGWSDPWAPWPAWPTALPPLPNVAAWSDGGVSSAELAGAVAAAKEASGAVLAAQHHVAEAKHNVLAHQRIASAKEAAAADTIQRSEAVVSAARAAALAAAQGVVGAQAALAAAKARVAAAQRVAAAREADAARLLHRSAHHQAKHLHQKDLEAVKLSLLQTTGAAGAAGAAHQSAAATHAALLPHPSKPWLPLSLPPWP